MDSSFLTQPLLPRKRKIGNAPTIHYSMVGMGACTTNRNVTAGYGVLQIKTIGSRSPFLSCTLYDMKDDVLLADIKGVDIIRWNVRDDSITIQFVKRESASSRLLNKLVRNNNPASKLQCIVFSPFDQSECRRFADGMYDILREEAAKRKDLPRKKRRSSFFVI